MQMPEMDVDFNWRAKLNCDKCAPTRNCRSCCFPQVDGASQGPPRGGPGRLLRLRFETGEALDNCAPCWSGPWAASGKIFTATNSPRETGSDPERAAPAPPSCWWTIMPSIRKVASAALSTDGISRRMSPPTASMAVGRTRATAATELVFMDVQMPEMDGWEATRRIRQIETTPPPGQPHRHQIVHRHDCQCHAGRPREVRLDAGMDDYVSKPVQPEALQDLLERWGTIAKEELQQTAAVAPARCRRPRSSRRPKN